jgi:hypothetical protein
MAKGFWFLTEEQKGFLEKVLDRDGGRWVSNVGELDLDGVKRMRDIIEYGRYDSFDREMLNDIRELWVRGVSMRI